MPRNIEIKALVTDRGELIFYEWPDETGPKLSDYLLTPDQSAAAGEAVAADLLAALGIAPADLVRGAYRDLLRDGR